ncbi:MAG: RecQ family ATP-dependent DNA helicase [Syntrophobacteraceae bacterium]|nr:RecQ family ATP-dependent DNA helicase [Syntrophobacteraceae bacterium]
MELDHFISKCVVLDLEAGSNRIFKIGAILGDTVFEKEKFDIGPALKELDRFAAPADFLLGHNLLGHDLPILRKANPALNIFDKPVIDTLFLSPLAFPENPYHRLVKDYKLVKDALSDPVADSRIALSLFCDQWEKFSKMAADGYSDILSFYRYCFLSAVKDGQPDFSGISAFLQISGAHDLGSQEARAVFTRHVSEQVCRTALRELFADAPDPGEKTPALSYVLAWLRVAGANSVLPPWVRKRFPAISTIAGKLRDVPCGHADCSWCRVTHDSSEQLKRFFAFSSFRDKPAGPTGQSLQKAVVDGGMAGRPLLAIFPTGGGKSICYQLPALVRHYRRGALTIVISPLQALMKDQVDNLASRTGTPYAAALNGLLTPPQRRDVLERTALGDVALLYVAPEQFRNDSFRKAIAQREIGAWVFDEAHCLSKWGHDFRPDYLYAGRFIREYSAEQTTPMAPVSCFTATAKQEVIEEIIEYFRRETGQELELFQGGLERENLHFEVRTCTRSEKLETIHLVLAEHLPESLSGGAIVYVATRRNADLTAQFLKSRGWPAAAFHAGLDPSVKNLVQEQFLAGDLQVIAATNAFGMGVDKSDVRLVLHADIPGSLESYIQEAGRAGRDLRDSKCVLLYDEQDIETQFKLGARSELSRKDIAQILRSIRRARKEGSEDVVLTAGEILRQEDLDTSFDAGDSTAETKVKTAIAWLERARFLERNENHTRVFQGRVLVQNLEEAEKRIAGLNLSATQKTRWLAILREIMNAPRDRGMSADSLAELSEFEKGAAGLNGPGKETPSQRVIRTLHDMAVAGLIEKGLVLSAYVRYKVKSHSHQVLENSCRIENEMLKIMREEIPDAADLGWLDLSLGKINSRIKNQAPECSVDSLRSILMSISMDGKGFGGGKAGLQYRHIYGDFYKVKLNLDWDSLLAMARKRQKIARAILDGIFSQIPSDTPPGADLLVSFSSEELAKTFQANLFLANEDVLTAIDRGLLFLHEQRAIILKQGLAVFRQAMSIRILPREGRRGYSKSDYEPLSHYYRERIFQVHGMNEYARLGAREIVKALELVLSYFTLSKAEFIRRYFPGRKEMLERATSQESYRKMVEDLANPAQSQIVSGDEITNTLILAGPGAGKTKVVIHRCAYLIRVQRANPESILIVCFNHSAAMELRRKLVRLIGEDAAGVTVQTYHGIAMRLTGTSFSDLMEKGTEQQALFDQVIADGVRLLQGDADLPGWEPDAVRDRLLGRFRHILVDEYQDIDQKQYDLVSALAGRTERDPDTRLTICAVGDDDQNIYAFRGSNVRFILKFQEDYEARIHYLTENYRSTRNIIDAANALIARNKDRMKTGHPIRINTSRIILPPGGKWEELDPVSRGRVRIIDVPNAAGQAAALLSELHRMAALQSDFQWSEVAVLSKTRESLHEVRAFCERGAIPVTWTLGGNHPNLSRIREIASFLGECKSRRSDFLRASDLEMLLENITGEPRENPWWKLPRSILTSWREETGDARLPVSTAIDRIYEELAEVRRDQRIGNGLFLSTIHGVKGLEFPHVFILDGNWKNRPSPQALEEERRLLYVAMTRARETLSLFARADCINPHLSALSADFALRIKAASSPPPDLSGARYETLSMKDFILGFAGRFPENHPIHRQQKKLGPGAPLSIQARGDQLFLCDSESHPVAKLSLKARDSWAGRVDKIRSISLLAMVQRTKDDERQDFRKSCRTDSWEIPWAEVVLGP